MHSAFFSASLSAMLYSAEAVMLVGRKPLKTSSSGERGRERERGRKGERKRVTKTEDFYYQQGFF